MVRTTAEVFALITMAFLVSCVIAGLLKISWKFING